MKRWISQQELAGSFSNFEKKRNKFKNDSNKERKNQTNYKAH